MDELVSKKNSGVVVNKVKDEKNSVDPAPELKKYSFEPRRKGQPRNTGCINELEGIEECDIRNPEHLARLVKEGIHLMYQKNTSEKIIRYLLEYL